MADYIKLCVDIPEDVYNNMVIKNEYTERDVIAIHNALVDAAVIRSRLLDHKRKFERIDVVYPSEDSCIYPEYKGKPYFSIQYEENGEHIVGFGTYNPEVLSRWLIEDFITPIIMEAKSERNEIVDKVLEIIERINHNGSVSIKLLRKELEVLRKDEQK